MKKEKTLAITLYVFSVIALCYATFLLFQAHSQVVTYNQSSYVPMAAGEVIAFLFGNTYVPLFFAVIFYGLANVIEMLTEMKNPRPEKDIENEPELDESESSIDMDADDDDVTEEVSTEKDMVIEDDITEEMDSKPEEIEDALPVEPEEDLEPVTSDEDTVDQTSQDE